MGNPDLSEQDVVLATLFWISGGRGRERGPSRILSLCLSIPTYLYLCRHIPESERACWYSLLVSCVDLSSRAAGKRRENDEVAKSCQLVFIAAVRTISSSSVSLSLLLFCSSLPCMNREYFSSLSRRKESSGGTGALARTSATPSVAPPARCLYPWIVPF